MEDTASVAQISIVPECTRREVLQVFNATQRSFPQDKLLQELFEEQVARTPDSLALVLEGESLTYDEVNARANQLARYLRKRGAGAEELVAICMERSLEMVIGLLGILKSGSAYVPLDPAYPAERLAYMLSDAAPRVLLTQARLHSVLPKTTAQNVTLDRQWDEISKERAENLNARELGLLPGNLAYVIYTSGSTGKPKGAMNEHRAVVNRLHWMQWKYMLTSDDRVLQKTPFSFDVSVWEFLWTLTSGAKLVLARPEGHKDQTYLGALIRDCKVTRLHFVPSMLRIFLDHTRPGDCASLRHIVCSGEELSASLARQCITQLPECRLSNLYGPTEAAIDVTSWECIPGDTSPRIPIGHPISNLRMYLLDANMEVCQLGTAGHLYIGGAGVGRGYWHRSDLTAERFLPDPFSSEPWSRMYKTGDLGRSRGDGSIEYLGRDDHQIKIHGFRVELGEITEQLLAHPEVKEAAVLACEDAVYGKRLVAYLTMKDPDIVHSDGNSLSKEESELVSRWQRLYEDTYSTVTGGPTFIGWNSSYTGLPIPEDQMREWLRCTAKRIREYKPRRVLEIGCGVGLLIEQLAAECEVYVGTDISSEAITAVRHWLKTRPEFGHVSIEQCPALEATKLCGRYDMVILNSVAQYFPSVHYLREVLRQAAKCVCPGGHVFVGDLRHLGLLNVFHSTVQLQRATDETNVGVLRQRVAHAVYSEKELVVDPSFFQSLLDDIPDIIDTQVLLKRGAAANELTLYRYDAVLTLASARNSSPRTADKISGLHRVKNKRLSRDLLAARLLEESATTTTAAHLRGILAGVSPEGEDPETICGVAEERGLEIRLSCAAGYPDGSFDVEIANGRHFEPGDLNVNISSLVEKEESGRRTPYANVPLGRNLRSKLVKSLRTALEKTLPSVMVPGAFVILNRFPLSPNGKLDHRALGAPDNESQALNEYEPPGGPVEEMLVSLWRDLLGVERIGTTDNFFELGGHSLLVIELVEQLRLRGWSIEGRNVYECPQVSDLAKLLVRSPDGALEIAPYRIPPGTDKITPEMLTLVTLEPEHLAAIESCVPGGAPNIQDIYPLTPIQEGMLFHRLFDKSGADRYIHAILLSFSSPEMLAAFIAAFQCVIDRHDALRTAILWEGLPHPLQVVYRRAALPMEEVTLDESTSDGAVEYFSKRMTPEVLRLKLNKAPLIHVEAARLPEGKCLALLTIHHMIHDLVSLDVLCEELVYHLRGQQKELAAPTAYRTYVSHISASAGRDRARNYFRGQLADITAPTAPFEILDTQGLRREFDDAQVSLPDRTVERIRRQARYSGVGVAAIFHAAWALVLGSIAGRSDVVFGTVLLGRLKSGMYAQRSVGVFVNTLPLRLGISQVSATDLVMEAHRKLLDLMEFEQTPLPLASGCSGVEHPAPLFTSLMNYYSSMEGTGLSRLNAYVGLKVVASRNWTNYPISVWVDDTKGGISLMAQTDRSVEASRVINYLQTATVSLVDALALAPQTPVVRLQTIPEREWREAMFTTTQSAIPRTKQIQELFEDQVAKAPDSVALVFNGASLTYNQLNARANQLARYLRKKGAGAEKLIAICTERSLEMVIGVLGILKSGAAYVPLDPAYPRERLAYLLSDAAPRILLTQTRFLDSLPETTPEVVALDGHWGNISMESEANLGARMIRLLPANLAYVIYTSGSTGRPKGVMVEHCNVTRLFGATAREFCFCDGDVWTLFHSFAFDFSVWEIWGALLHGGRLVIVPQIVSRSPPELYRLLCDQGVTVLNQTPSAFSQLIEAHAEAGGKQHSLRLIVFGGEALELRRLRPWVRYHGAKRPQLVNMYGITETTVHVTYCPLSEEEIESETGNAIGRPISDLGIRITDQCGRPTGIGVKGEICVTGAGVSRGYLNRPELTAERFIAAPADGHTEGRMYRSGDMGRWRRDGYIEYLGRNDEQIKIRGFRIEPGEVEDQLARHELVKEAVVLAREDIPGEKRLVAYVVPAGSAWDATRTVRELREYLKRMMPAHMVPGAFVTLQRMPLNHNGKLEKRALPVPDFGAGEPGGYEAPEGERERTLARIWSEILGVERVGRDSSFFELGGHSLIALKAIGKINQALGASLGIADLYQSPTIRELALHGTVTPGDSELVELSREAILGTVLRAPSADQRAPGKSILLTGCTGFVGRFLLSQLLQDTTATIYCVVRAQSSQHAMSRIRNTLIKWDLWREEWRDRLIAIAGDLNLPHLGFDNALWLRLCHEIDSIYHCGASMNHLETYAMAKPANVGGARELASFAATERRKLINYISTLSVFSPITPRAAGVINENTPIEPERHRSVNGYAASKWVGEKLFMTAAEQGVPCNIFRLSLIWADTRKGRYDELQREYRIFKSCLLSGYGIRDYRFEMPPTPVDSTARAVIALADLYRSGQGIFHISSAPPAFDDIFERCNDISGTYLEMMSSDQWTQKMQRLYHQGISLPVMPLIDSALLKREDYLDQTDTEICPMEFNCTRTNLELERMEITLPALDDELFALFLNDMLSRDSDLRKLPGHYGRKTKAMI